MVKTVVLCAILVPLFFVSLKGKSHYLVVNVALAPILATFSRLVGGVDLQFQSIKFIFLASALILLVKQNRLRTKGVSVPLFLFVSLVTFSFVSAFIIEGISQGVINEFDQMGLIYMVLVFFVPVFGMESSELVGALRTIIIYVFVPVAVFGIFQFLVGPAFIERLGFTLVTRNTESTFSKFFDRSDAMKYLGAGAVRPFSFLYSSGDFAALMFHAVVWTIVLFRNELRNTLRYKILLLLFLVGLGVAQFVTVIILTLFAVVLFEFVDVSRTERFRRFVVDILTVAALLFAVVMIVPEVGKRISVSVNLADVFDTPSLGSRLLMIMSYPSLLKGHFLFGYGYSHMPLGFTPDQRILYISLLVGVPVAVYMLFFYSAILKSAWRKMKRSVANSNDHKLYVIVVLTMAAAILGNLSNGQIDSTGPSNILTWIIAGAAIAPTGIRARNNVGIIGTARKA